MNSTTVARPTLGGVVSLALKMQSSARRAPSVVESNGVTQAAHMSFTTLTFACSAALIAVAPSGDTHADTPTALTYSNGELRHST